MAYIGKSPAQIKRDLSSKDSFTGDGSTTTFDLTDIALDANHIQVFVDNVRQEPGAGKSYTLGQDGSGDLKRITFTAAPDLSATIYVINEGTRTHQVTTVSCGAITTAKLGGDAVTGAKLADDAVDSEHLTDGSVDNVHLSGSIADSKLSTITTASKVNVSALSAPGSTSLFLRGDRTYAAIDTSGIDTNRFNISLLGFKMAVNEGLTVFNLIDGIVDEFHDESGTDESEGSNDTYCATSDFYENRIAGTPISTSAGFGMASVTEEDTSEAGTNPTQGSGTYGTFTVPAGLTSLSTFVWGAGGSGGYGNPGTPQGGGGGFVTGCLAVSQGQGLQISAGEGGGSGSLGSPGPAFREGGFGGHGPVSSEETGGGDGSYGWGGGLSGIFAPTVDFSTTVPTGSAPGVYLVAGSGGGGGGHNNATGTGGTGGGSSGGDGTGNHGGEGGSQTAGGTSNGSQAGGFLYGGAGPGDSGGGGGAGYYGGGGGGTVSGEHGGGGGGSGYIGHPDIGGSGGNSGAPGNTGAGEPNPNYSGLPSSLGTTGPGSSNKANINEGGGHSGSADGGYAGGDGYVLMTGTAVPQSTGTSTIVSTAFAAGSVPSTARIVVFEEDVDTPTLNSHLVASISRDGGANYTTATLSDSGYVTGASGQRILTGQATISGQPSGQSMRWKLGINTSHVKIHGVSLQWA
tara:strand:- start:461 stop:2515 length:2055 start_codon:yes stop_codon:yes gene_type:complete